MTASPVAKPPVIAVVDYGLGNLASVVWGIERAGGAARIASTPGDLLGAGAGTPGAGGATAPEVDPGIGGLILPGVGSFGPAARVLAGPMGAAVRSMTEAGRPILGICLGMQLLFQWSEEDARENRGLGLFAGGVRRLEGAPRLPHMGWNRITVTGTTGTTGAAGPTFPSSDILDRRHFYFAHSYVALPRDYGVVLGEAEYGETFPAVVTQGNVTGVQFHPERSGAAGRVLIERFVTACSPSL